MQTKTKTKLLTTLFVVASIGSFLRIDLLFAASLSSTLSEFVLSESPSAGNHETDFILNLNPEPTDQVNTTYSTNGECVIGHNLTDYTAGGVIVTKNPNLVIGLRAVDDSDSEGQHMCDITFTSVSTFDSEYADPVVLNYSVEIIDNEAPVSHEFSLSKITAGRMQEGGSLVEQYQIDVSYPPTQPLTINAIADGQCDLLVGTPQVRTKTAQALIEADSTTPARFTIIPSQDNVFEGLHKCSISHMLSTLDADYRTKTIGSYTATLADDDPNPNIPDDREYEGGLIYYRDANFDDIEDSEQPNVTSFINVNRDARQAVLLVDEQQNLHPDCSFAGGVESRMYDGEFSSIQSNHGQVQFDVECVRDAKYSVLWLLDEYDKNADLWRMFSTSRPGAFDRLEHNAIVFNLGDQFTTGLVVEATGDTVQLLQGNADFAADLDEDIESSLIASVQNDRLQPLTVVSGALAISVVLWLVYRHFFSGVQTVRSRYPRVDRF